MLGELVNRLALSHQLRPDLVMCIVLQESGGDTFANRFEPAFYQTYLATKESKDLSGFVPNNLPNLTTEKHNRATSWGLMQVMGDTARWCARVNSPYLTVLLDPERGIDAGCRVLAYYLAKEKGNYDRALARYNAGNPESPTGQKYAREVFERLKRGEHLKYFKGE